MNIYDDYINYMNEKNDLIDKLYSTDSELLFCLEDVIKVCDFIYKLYDKKETISDEMSEIFEIGFGYLVNNFNDLDNYYKDCLDSDMILFAHYSRILVYSILLEDYKAYLLSNDNFEGSEKEEIEKCLKFIDETVSNKKTYTDEDVELLEKTFASACNEEYKPSYIIFAMIYDELAN